MQVSGEGKEWRTKVWRRFGNDMGVFENTFYPLNGAIIPFWFIRTGLDLYAEQSAYEDYVEPTTGKTIQVERSAAGEVTAPYSLYTALFDQTIVGKQIIGLNCYLPDSLIPGREAQIKRESLDELLGGF